MIDLSDRPDVGWNVLLVGSLVAIVAAIWYGFLMPIDYHAKAPESKVNRAYGDARQAQGQADAARKAIQAKAWDSKLDTLGSRTLAMLTGLADKHKVQLSGFRTDKPSDSAGLIAAPSVVTIEGPFPDTMAFVGELEAKDSKLAIQLMQITASDNSPGSVTTTLGLVGYVLKEAR